MKNLKDLVTTICGILGLICGFIQALPDSSIITPVVKTTAIAIGGFCVAIIGYMSGKNPDGSTKVINPQTGQQDVNPNITKQEENKNNT